MYPFFSPIMRPSRKARTKLLCPRDEQMAMSVLNEITSLMF